MNFVTSLELYDIGTVLPSLTERIFPFGKVRFTIVKQKIKLVLNFLEITYLVMIRTV
jgi:hypothetical protein